MDGEEKDRDGNTEEKNGGKKGRSPVLDRKERFVWEENTSVADGHRVEYVMGGLLQIKHTVKPRSRNVVQTNRYHA